MSPAESIGEMFVLFAFSDQFKLGSGMRTRHIRMRGHRNGAGASIHGIVFRGKPDVINYLVEGPPAAEFLLDPDAEVSDIAPAKLIPEIHFVVGRRIDLIVCAPS